MNRIVASSSGATSGSATSSDAVVEQVGEAPARQGWSMSIVTTSQAAQVAAMRSARGASARISLGSVSCSACSSSSALPPAVEQGRDRAGLERPPCSDRSRPGSCAWRCRPGRPCRCRARPAPRASRSDSASSSAKVSRSSPATTASTSAFSAQKVLKKQRQGRREIGDDRPALARRCSMTTRPPGPVTAASTASNFRSSSVSGHPSLLGLLSLATL